MSFRKGEDAPETMCRGAAVVHGNTAYFRPAGSVKVYSYQNIQGEEQWSQLPDNPNVDCGLVVIDGLPTSVGGYYFDHTTKSLLSLREGESSWSEIFPPMPTPRSQAVCVTTEQSLVVAGGVVFSSCDTVEVMNTTTKQWTTVSPLPEKCWRFSATVYGGKLYMAGGYINSYSASKSVFTCSLPDLLPPTTPAPQGEQFSPTRNVWKKISSLPVKHSTLVSFSGDLLAIGGRDDESDISIPIVYRYDSHTDSWTMAHLMRNKRSFIFAVSLPEDHLIVVGGLAAAYSASAMDSVETMSKT